MSTELAAKGSLATRNKPSYYVNSLICVGIMLLFRFIPPVEPITALGMNILGIFIGMIYGWLTVGMAWPSLFGIILLGLSGMMSVADAFKSGFGNNTILLILFSFILTGVLGTSGVAKWIANKLVSFKIARGRPWVLSFLILFSMFVLSSVISITAAIMVVWSMFYGICEVYQFKKGEKWPMLMLVGIAFSGSLAYQLFPFKSLPAVVIGNYADLSGGGDINFFRYFIWMLITDWIIIGIYLLVMKFVFKPDVSKIKNSDASIVGEEKLTPYQRFILIYFICYIVAVLLPSILPADFALTILLNKINTTGITALFVLGLVFINFKEGGTLGDMFRPINWDLIFLLVGALTISSAISNADTGITAWISQVMGPVLQGKSFLIFAFLLILAATVVTNFCNNMATVAIFTPIAYNLCIASGAGVNVKAIMVVLITVCSTALITPAGSTPAALIYGNKEWVPGKYPFTLGLFAVAATFVVMFCIGLPLANVLF